MHIYFKEFMLLFFNSPYKIRYLFLQEFVIIYNQIKIKPRKFIMKSLFPKPHLIVLMISFLTRSEKFLFASDSLQFLMLFWFHSYWVYLVQRAALAACSGLRSKPVTRFGKRKGSADMPSGVQQGSTIVFVMG